MIMANDYRALDFRRASVKQEETTRGNNNAKHDEEEREREKKRKIFLIPRLMRFHSLSPMDFVLRKIFSHASYKRFLALLSFSCSSYLRKA